MSFSTPSSSSSGFAYRPALDGLRAVAVLGVIAYHLDYDWARGGFLGVDTFFVLSGYLITSLLLTEWDDRSGISLGGFWTRRIKRLLPAVLLLLVAVAGYAAFVAPAAQLDTLRGDSLATLFYVANWRFIVEGTSYFDLFSEASPLRHMWSLAIEEQFYLLWPLLTLGLLRLGRGGRQWLTAFVVVGIVTSVALMVSFYDAADPSRAYFGTDTRAHSLLAGALLALILARLPAWSGRANVWLQMLGVGAAIGVLWSFARVSDVGEVYYHGGSFAFALTTALVIAASVQTEWSPLRSALDRQPLRWIGQVSYGLYLWHWPMIVWLTRGRTGFDGWQLDVLRIGATFAVATSSYYLVERPIRYGTIPRARVAVLTPTAMVVTAMLLLGATTGGTTSPLEFSGDFAVPEPEAPTTPTDASATTSGAPTTTTGEAPVDATDASGVTGDPPAATRPVRVVALAGDSVARTIEQSLSDAFRSDGKEWVSIAFPGCGVAAGFMLDANGQPYEWSEPCAGNVAGTQTTLVAEHDPDLVLWHSSWELADRLEDGEHVRFGTPEHDAALIRDIDAAVERFTARGGRVVFLLLVPNAINDVRDHDHDGVRVGHLNEIMRSYARDNPDRVVVVDLNPIVCPDGVPCPSHVDGIRLRPDGGHYSEEGSEWLIERVLPEIERAIS